MKKLEFGLGSNIENACLQLTNNTKDGDTCVGEFNGVLLVAYPGTSPGKIEKFYSEILIFNREQYEKTDEYKKSQKKEAKQIAKLKRKRDILMKNLPLLDFSNLKELLAWLCDFQEPSDRVGVEIDNDTIVSVFQENGFIDGMNTGDDFIENDKTNYAGYIIGQALSDLASGHVIHHMVLTFTERWESEFS